MVDIERACIRAEDECASDEELQALESHHHVSHLRLVTDERNAIDVTTRLVRRFLGMADDEPTELSVFVHNRPRVAQVLTVDDHVRVLREGERLPGYTGSYMLANPIDRRVLHRYTSNEIHRADNHRVSDREITARRALYIDCDAIRPKGISSTDDEFREAVEVADRLEAFLVECIGSDRSIGRGSSGNGSFLLVALEPRPVDSDDTNKIAAFLGLLDKKFRTERVKIDASVFNAGRLMPAPGTMKCKGTDSPERPHRRTSFVCRPNVERIRMEDLL